MKAYTQNRVYETLIERGIEEKYATNLLSRAYFENQEVYEEKDILGIIEELMIDDLKEKSDLSIGISKPKVLFFIGPPGAGKTTMIAHMTVELDAKSESFGFVCADMYKLGGLDQLQQIAKIYDAPFDSWDSHFRGNRERLITPKHYSINNQEIDYILVDTTAVYRKKEDEWKSYFERLYDAFDGLERAIRLVLPATGKYEDLIRITDNISKDYDFGFVFTKLDETEAYGSIYNLHQRTGKAIKHITFGPSIGDDFRSFDAKQLVDVIMED